MIPGEVLPVTVVQTLDDGHYTALLEVSDGVHTASDTVELTVVNAEPVATGAVDAPTAGGVALLTASFTELGPLDTHAASVDWGDGSAPEEVPISAEGTGWGSLYAAHVYANAGSYPISATIADDDGGTSTIALTSSSVEVGRSVAIWATSATGNGVDWTGGGGSVSGLVHSNGGIRVKGAGKSLVGGVEYGTTVSLPGGTVVDPPAVKVSAGTAPVTFTVDDYRPGGAAAIAAGLDYHDMTSACDGGEWEVESCDDDDSCGWGDDDDDEECLPPGLYWAPCDVHLHTLVGAYTFVSDGQVQVDGEGAALTPFVDGLVLLGAGTGDAVQISGSDSTFSGYVSAPSATVRVSGSDHRFVGGLLADAVRLSGSRLTIQGTDATPPATTTAPPLLAPELLVTLDLAPVDALAAEPVTSTVTVENASALLLVQTVVGVVNDGLVDATLSEGTVVLEGLDPTTGAWTALPAQTLDVRPLQGGSAAFAGTVVAPGATALFGAEIQAALSPEDVQALLDPTRTAQVRASASLAGYGLRTLTRYGEDLAPALRTQGGTLSEVSVTLTTVDGTTRVYVPTPSTLGPGELAVLAVEAPAPGPAPLGSTEPAANYLGRLHALDGTGLGTLASARSVGGVGLVLGPQELQLGTLHVPVIDGDLLAATVGIGGQPLSVSVELANRSTVDASNVLAEGAVGDEPATSALGPVGLASGGEDPKGGLVPTTREAPINPMRGRGNRRRLFSSHLVYVSMIPRGLRQRQAGSRPSRGGRDATRRSSPTGVLRIHQAREDSAPAHPAAHPVLRQQKPRSLAQSPRSGPVLRQHGPARGRSGYPERARVSNSRPWLFGGRPLEDSEMAARTPLNIDLNLENLRCFDEGDGIGSAEPYLWSVFFKVDGDTVALGDDLQLHGTATVIGTPGSHGNLGDTDVDAGDNVPVPSAIGHLATSLTPIPVPAWLAELGTPDVGGVVGVAVVLMEEDNVTDAGAEAGHAALNTFVQQAIDGLIPTLGIAHPEVTDEDIAALTDGAESAIADAIEAAQSGWDNFVSWLNADDQIGNAVFTFTHDQLVEDVSVDFSKRWSNEGDWELTGNIIGVAPCAVEMSMRMMRVHGIVDPGVSDKAAEAIRAWRKSQFAGNRELGAWWALATRNTAAIARLMHRDPAFTKQVVVPALVGVAAAVTQPGRPIPEPTFAALEKVLNHLRDEGPRRLRIDAKAAVGMLPKLAGADLDQAKATLGAHPPSRRLDRKGGKPRAGAVKPATKPAKAAAKPKKTAKGR
ncbi:MAG: PKD domain-containing protein [Myxococcota bacterium]